MESPGTALPENCQPPKNSVTEEGHNRNHRTHLTTSLDGSEKKYDAIEKVKMVKRCACPFLEDRFRYIILLIAVLCLTSIYANMSALNFTMIVMTKENKEYVAYLKNGSTLTKWPSPPKRVHYSPEEKSHLLSAVGLASIVSTFPFSAAYARFGARWAFAFAGFLSAVSTFLIPFASEAGMGAFICLRIFQGIAYGANFAAIGVVCSQWASLRQHGLFLSCMTNFTSIAAMITNPMAAMISSISEFSWHWVYYVHAGLTPILFSLWLFLYRDQPNKSPCLSEREFEKIQRGKTQSELNLNGKEISFWTWVSIISEIATNKIILVVWFNAVAEITTAVFVLTYMPLYTSKVLGYGVKETGIYSSLPALVHVPLKVFLGWYFDRMKCMSEINKMRLANSLAVLGTGICFVVVGFVPDNWPFVAVLIFTLHHGLGSANCGGFYKCGTFVSRQYAHFVVAGIQFLKSLTMFVSPILVATYVPDETDKTQWRQLFLGMAIILFVANFVFYFMASDQPAEFTKRDSSKEKEKPVDI